MKKHIALLIILAGLFGYASAQDYPKQLNEFGFSMGILDRHNGNVDQGRDEDSYPAYRLAFDYQPRFGVLLGGLKQTIEVGGFYNDFFYNVSIGGGFAIFKNKRIRVDGMLYAGPDISSSIGLPWFRPSLSYNLSMYFDNFRVSLAGRGSIGWIESYSETGITIGYFFRRQEYAFQKLELDWIRTTTNDLLGI